MTDQRSDDVQALDVCPNCFSELRSDDPVCATCGFDTLAGQGLPPSEVDSEESSG